MHFAKKNIHVVNVGLKTKYSVEIMVITILQSFIENKIE